MRSNEDLEFTENNNIIFLRFVVHIVYEDEYRTPSKEHYGKWDLFERVKLI